MYVSVFNVSQPGRRLGEAVFFFACAAGHACKRYLQMTPANSFGYALLGPAGLTASNADGLFGTAVATMGMLSTAAYVLTMDVFGPISDNAGGIVEMSQQPESVRQITDLLVRNLLIVMHMSWGKYVMQVLSFWHCMVAQMERERS